MRKSIIQYLPTNTLQVFFIAFIFIVSRVLLYFSGVTFDYSALFRYWQFLDIETLQHNLLKGVWYSHAQPPVYNLFLGGIIKLFGTANSETVFIIIYKLLTLTNTILLFRILKRMTQRLNLSLVISLLYVLSPATMLFENELFYTSLVSLLFLCCCYSLIKLSQNINANSALSFFIPLTLICLTRSMYHLVFLIVICIVLIAYFRTNKKRNVILVSTLISFSVVCGWYVKNYFIFGQFSASSWMGMNISRNVLHDNEITDSSQIASIPPFSPISHYHSFIKESQVEKFKSKKVKDLTEEWKNDSLKNLSHIDYITVSKRYQEECIQHIKKHPVSYLKNVTQSGIIFFAPGTMYSLTQQQAQKIKYYDAVYSFNLSHFSKTKESRRLALVTSAVPKIIIYLSVLFLIIREGFRRKKISPLNLFILITILFVFTTGSLFEHYENMRFRYELEPMFLILAIQALVILLSSKYKSKSGYSRG